MIVLFSCHPMVAGNPFFFIAMLTCIAGFIVGNRLSKN